MDTFGLFRFLVRASRDLWAFLLGEGRFPRHSHLSPEDPTFDADLASIETALNAIVLRFPIRFRTDRIGDAPIELRVRIRTSGRSIYLQALRRRPGPEVHEWYVSCQADMSVTFEPRPYPWTSEPLIIPRFLLEPPLRLTVGELGNVGGMSGPGAELDPIPDGFTLTGGSVSLSLLEGSNPGQRWPENIRRMWPTGVLDDITHLRLEPTGVHFQGFLGTGFFADEVRREVVLRLPQTHADLVAADTPLGTAHPELLVGSEPVRHVWTLTDHPFTEVDAAGRAFPASAPGSTRWSDSGWSRPMAASARWTRFSPKSIAPEGAIPR